MLPVMDGETLAEKLARRRQQSVAGGLPLVEILPIARQIADVLESAHERGTVHYGLRPENMQIASDGRVEVLDFGVPAPIGSSSSPEQVQRLPADKRTDVWALDACCSRCSQGGRHSNSSRSLVPLPQ